MKGRPRIRVAPCRFCNKEFKRQEHLDRHLRTHTREKPFNCSCGRTFSRLDLLTRHRRLSGCPEPIAITPQDRSLQVDSTTEFIDQASTQNLTVPSPSFLDIEYRRNSSFSCGSEPGCVFPLDGAGSDELTQTQTSTVHHDVLEPTQTRETMASLEYSQKELMGKFSIHNPRTTSKDKEPAQPLHRTSLEISDENMNAGVENGLDFMHPQLFDLDFLGNETDLISEYLTDNFPPMDCQPGLDDASNLYGGSQLFTAPPAITGFGMSPPLETSATPSKSQSPSFQSTPHQGNQIPDTPGGPLDAIDEVVATNPWTVSTSAYERLTAEVAQYDDVLPQRFTLPSRHTLSRYVASWMRSFHPHLPFIHIPTTRLESKTPMLVLTLAATGSFYGFEHTHGYAMYFIAKSIITKKLEERRRASTLHLLQSFPRYAGPPTGSPGAGSQSYEVPPLPDHGTTDIELLQSLLVLIMTMSWLDGPLAQDALAMSSQLTELTREALKCPVTETTDEDWEGWGREEERRRTVIAAYFVMNIITICFNIPPQITSSEIKLPIPCSEAEFRAPNSNAWSALRQKRSPHRLDFQKCLQQLLSGKPLEMEGSTTEFGNYMLVQILLIQVFVEHQARSYKQLPSSILEPDVISFYDKAFGAWQSCWDLSMESALDPSSSHGPLAFNSTAILRLAHIHLAVGLQGQCALRSRDPKTLALEFEPERNPVPYRSPHLDQAVWHAICALRIPVRVGIAFVARGRTGHWSVQHAISNFACALLLTHWFENVFQMVSSNGLESLRPEERRLLSIVERLVEETHLEGSLGSKTNYARRIRRLAIAAVTLWAEISKGTQVYEIVHVVGETLSLVAESLERRLQGQET